MAVTKSKSQDISSPEGNSLAVFLDGNDNILKVKDIYGVMQPLDELSNAVEEVDVEADSGLTVIRVGDTVTLGTDGAVLQRKDEKGVANGYASLDADGKIPVDQLPNSVLTYEGTWDAATNTPTLADGTGNQGDFYIVSVAGTQDLGSGPISFSVGDWVIYSGTIWQVNPSATETLQTVTDRGNTTTNGITTASTTSDFFELNTTAGHTLDVAQAAWNDSQGTWSIGMQIDSNLVENDLGLKTFYPVCRNTDPVGDLPKGTLVMVDTSDIATGDRLNVVRAVTDGTYSAQLIVGILAEDIAANDVGFVQWFGQIKNIPQSNINLNGETWAEAQILYADPTNAGGLTNVAQVAPNKKSTIAVITALNGSNVSLLVRPWLGQNLSELNDVTLTAVSDNDILQYNSSTQTWENVEGTTTSIAEGLNLYFTQARARASFSATDGVGYTEATGVFTNTDKGSSQNIIKTIDGDTGTITADSNNDSIQVIGGTNVTTDISGKTLTINSTDQFQGTVTSVAVTESGGLSVTGSPITTAGTINLENTDKGSSQNIFKNIASSGQPTIVAGSNNATFFVEGAGTTSITQDAGTNTITISSADEFDGTVTSVDITAGSGISSTGGPITSSGSITVTNTDKGSDQNIFKRVLVDNDDEITADNNNDRFYIVGGLGIQTLLGDLESVEIENTDRGSSQNIFKNVAVSGQDTIVADSNDDTLNLVAGANVTITTDAATDSITISSPDAGGTVTSVDITAGDGISSAGGPITSSGSITVTNTDRGSSQNIFKNFIVDNDDTITADSNNDRIFILGGDGISTLMADTESIEIQNDDRGSSQNIFKQVASDTGDTFATSNNSVLTIVGASGEGIYTGTSASGHVEIYNADKGSSQNIFKNVAVSGQSTIVADSNNDTLTLAEGSGIVITTDAATDTITISSPDAGGTVTSVDLTAGAGMVVSGGPITTSGSITVTNNDRGSEQLIFKNFNADTGSVSASTNNDTLTIEGGTNVTTSISGSTLTINSTDQYDGTVTSVDLTAGAGMVVSGGPITTSGSITVTNNDRGSEQLIFKNFTADTGSIAASTNNDTLNVLGGTGMDTSISGANLTITNTDTGSAQAIFKNFAVAGQNTVRAEINNDTLTLIEGANITITTDDVNDTITISSPDAGGTVTSVAVSAGSGMSVSGSPITTSGTITVTNTDRGSSQAIFKNFAVSGQSTVVADSNNDTLTLVAGTNVSITTNATTDSITINSTDQYVGTVTSVGITAGSGIVSSGGPITSSGNITVSHADTSTLSGTYGSTSNAVKIDQITVDAFGHVTAITTGATGDIDGVTAGAGMSGGGTSGTVTLTNADRGSSQNIFKNFAVSGQDTIVADSNDDTLTLVAGANVTITTDAATDSITISSPDAGGTVTSVAVSAGTGMSVSGSPITTSGTITVTNTDRGSSQNIFKNVASDSGTAVADNNNDTLTIAGGTNVTTAVVGDTLTINSTDQYTGTVTSVAVAAGTGMSVSGSPITTSGTITVTNNDRGSSQNIFKNIAVSGQSTIVADANDDTLTFAAGDNVSITTNATTDTITITSTDQFQGTVTSVNLTAGTDITVSGGPITSSGSITVNHADTSTLNGTYGSSANGTKIDTITVDARGHVTAVTTGATGDILGVTAGDGLSGGGTSGTVTLTNADKGSSQAIFKTVAVSGQTSIVADSNNDTLTFAAGSNISLTTNATTDTLTINATSSPPPICRTGTNSVVNYCGSNVVGGGTNYSAVLGGTNNLVSSDSSHVGSGTYNIILASAQYSNISGGFQNRVCLNANRSFIGGGQANVINRDVSESYAAYGVIVGGANNSVNNCGQMMGFPAPIASVVGGYGNRATGAGSFIGGGFYSLAPALSGGTNNEAGAVNAVVVGGSKNCATGIGSVVVGGGALNPVIGLIYGNCSAANAAFIGAGSGNIVNSPYGFIGAGTGGTLTTNFLGSSGFIGANGVAFNASSPPNSTNIAQGNGMLIGTSNTIQNGDSNVMLSGRNNLICGYGRQNTIGNGFQNCITGGSGNFMAGGIGLCFGQPAYSNNRINGSSNFMGTPRASYIGGCWNAMSGGVYNSISSGVYNFIGGGCGNTVEGGVRNSISSGEGNRMGYCGIPAIDSFIGGGRSNIIQGGGSSGILSGSQNCIVSPQSYAPNHNTILGGGLNVIQNSCYSSAVGFGNIVQHSCSHAMGSQITTNRTNTLFVNNLSIMNIPTSPSGLPSGAVWKNGNVLNIV